MNKRWKLAQFWEIRWWQWYLQKKDKAIYLEQKARYWKRVLDQCELSLEQDMQVLDAGCGPAGIFLVLHGMQVTAIDPLLEAYEQQLVHFQRAAYPSIQFYTSSLEAFQADKAYDVIFCCNVINHVANLSLSLDRLSHWLKPGGTLILTVDVHNFQALKFLFRAIPGDILHPHQHDLADYVQMLVERKFELEKVTQLKTGLIFDYYLIKATSPLRVRTSPVTVSTSNQ